MHSNTNRSLTVVSITLLAISAFTFASVGSIGYTHPRAGQTASSPSAPSRKEPQPQQLFSGFWRADQGYESTLRIKNVLVVAPLDVTPVLFMADGTEYDLPVVSLPAGGISDLSVNQALDAAPSAIRRHLSDFGSLTLRFTSQSAVNAAANIQILNESQSLIFSISSKPFTHALMPFGPQNLESLWWKHDAGVNASVFLFNSSDSPKEVMLDVSGSAGTIQSLTLSLNAKSTTAMDLEPFIHGLPEAERLAGGIRVGYQGLLGDIFGTTTLSNASEGYSATSEFHPLNTMNAQAQPTSLSYGSVGLMVGAQDPMMGFPKDTSFSPYAILRNASARELNVKPQLFLMNGGNPRRVELPSEHFAPNQTKQLSFGSALSDFNGMATLTFSFDGHSGDLLMATGSVDQSGTYVFEVIPDSLGVSWAKNALFWSVTGGSDSMLTVFNPQDTPEDIVAKLTYAGGTGHYSVPLHLAAGETRMLDVKDLIDMQQPDPEGNAIPRDVTEGSAQFAGPNGQAQEIRIGLSAGLFNVQAATCGPQCQICTTTTNAFINPDPVAAPVGSSQQATAQATLSDGSTADETSSASWSSQNTSIATVQGGLVNRVGAGSTIIAADFQAPNNDLSIECPSACNLGPETPSVPAVWVTLSLRSSLTTSGDDSATGQYVTTIGTNNLGTLFSTGIGRHLWRTAVEIVGTVSPSNFTGTIILQRKIDGTCTYNVSTLISPCAGTTPDTSDLTLEDNDPQSGGSAGIVYDLDAPGLGTTSSDPVNTLLRVRTNFREWATLNGVPISYDFLWCSRISVIKSSSGDRLATDVAGDNTSCTGTTSLSWNLQ
jgi:hypothetical protein